MVLFSSNFKKEKTFFIGLYKHCRSLAPCPQYLTCKLSMTGTLWCNTEEGNFRGALDKQVKLLLLPNKIRMGAAMAKKVVED